MNMATTSHAERTNLSVRQFTRRFTRCTLGYSKKLKNLKHAVALFVWHFSLPDNYQRHSLQLDLEHKLQPDLVQC
jgi:mRNA-degrading endonuclease YafQ of YafQ-DinJ toxin-antitoxin module